MSVALLIDVLFWRPVPVALLLDVFFWRPVFVRLPPLFGRPVFVFNAGVVVSFGDGAPGAIIGGVCISSSDGPPSAVLRLEGDDRVGDRIGGGDRQGENGWEESG